MEDNLSTFLFFSGKCLVNPDGEATPEMKTATMRLSYVALDGDSPVTASNLLPDDWVDLRRVVTIEGWAWSDSFAAAALVA